MTISSGSAFKLLRVCMDVITVPEGVDVPQAIRTRRPPYCSAAETVPLPAAIGPGVPGALVS